jgi:hypothetical protein
MKTIKNFVESSHSSNEIYVKATGEKKNIVAIICWAGSCTFQHSMTPNQARELAGYLQAEANWCEQQAKQVEEVAA